MQLIRILSLFGSRGWFLLFLLWTLVLFGAAIYIEQTHQLEVCPMCILQRVAYFFVGIFALIGVLHGPKPFVFCCYSILILISALIGAAIAGRHVWLQYLPADQVPDCGPGLTYMLDTFPITDALRMVLSGSGECAEVQWQFLALSIPEWSLLHFVLIAVIAIIGIFQVRSIAT